MITPTKSKKINLIRWRYEHGRLLYEDVLKELIKQIPMTRRKAKQLVGKWIESWPRD